MGAGFVLMIISYLLFCGFQFLWAKVVSLSDRKWLSYSFILAAFVIEVFMPAVFVFIILTQFFIVQPTFERIFLFEDWTIYPILGLAVWTFYKQAVRFRFFDEKRVPVLGKWAYELGKKK